MNHGGKILNDQSVHIKLSKKVNGIHIPVFSSGLAENDYNIECVLRSKQR